MEPIFKLSSKQNFNTPYNYAYPFCNQIYRQLAIYEMKIGEKFTNLFKIKVYSKGHYLLKPGQIAHKFWLIKEGKAVLFRNNNGNEISCHFFVENDIMAMSPSYHLQIPSKYGIILIERTVVYEAKWDDLYQLQQTHVSLYDMEKKLINLFLLETLEHAYCLTTMNNEQHIAYLQKHKPLLFNHFKWGYLYTYLGMGYKSFYRGLKKLIKQRS